MFNLRDKVRVLLCVGATPLSGFVVGVSYGYDAIDVRLVSGELLLGLSAAQVEVPTYANSSYRLSEVRG